MDKSLMSWQNKLYPPAINIKIMNKAIIGTSMSMLLFFSCFNNIKNKLGASQSQSEQPQPKVIVHYMGWYSNKEAQEKKLRHWEYGHANTPIIGEYSSNSKATLVYHSLLAWSSGIDAIAINIKDQFDYETMAALFNTIDELQRISAGKFGLKYLISYDDQGFDIEEPLDTTYVKMKDFKDNLMVRKNYLNHNGRPLFFSFDYPKKYLTARSFKSVIDSVFVNTKPYLIWNTFGEGEEVQPFVGAFYPWVQPGTQWDAQGLNWGKAYLNYFYKEVNAFKTNYDFVVGGVWPGFDDRVNTSWGANRLMSRQAGKVYDETWRFIHEYKGRLPLEYVVLETWNDWNEGTEIEPSVEHGYQYLQQTIKQINQLKGTVIPEGISRFESVKEIYYSIQENNDEISDAIKNSIHLFISNQCKAL